MGKKKTNSLFAAIDNDNSSTMTNTSLSAVVENVETATIETVENIETNDIIQNLKNEISKLNADNAALTEKLAVYIENKPTEIDTTSVSAELEKLRYEKNELQNENDTYLMKISELSFENAKLTSQLQQLQALSKDPNVAAPSYCSNNSSQKTQTTNSNFVPYNRSNINGNKSNGYSSWN